VVIQEPGVLYVVATPIGNLGDLSTRARETLQRCGLIAAEDTRHTGIMLKAFGITTQQVALHEHNEAARAQEIVQRLREGVSVALVSDAGTPAISDPGFGLVRAAAAAGLEVVAVPGPCAAIAALSIGALPTDRFCFEGFLAARASARRQRLQELAVEPRTLVFYESPHRIAETLQACAAAFGDGRAATVVREVTKRHESVYRGTLRELAERSAEDTDFRRGEIVLLVAGAGQPGAVHAGVAPAGGGAESAEGGAGAAANDGHGGRLDAVLGVLMAELPLKQAARLAAAICAARDNEAYKRALYLKDRPE
jgi:16S rRNA (cytidine1402-2'-O)-methyltransferase